MKKWSCATVVGVMLGLMPVSGSAGTLQVDFGFQGGRVAFGIPAQIAADGRNVAGAATVVLSGVDPMGAITGAAATGRLQGFTLEFTVTAPGLAPAMVQLVQPGVANGPFDGVGFPIAPGALSLQGATSARGASFAVANATAFQPQLFSLEALGSAQLSLSAFLPGVGTPLAVQFILTGREISRSFVPEPSAPWLAALALLLLGTLSVALSVTRSSVGERLSEHARPRQASGS